MTCNKPSTILHEVWRSQVAVQTAKNRLFVWKALIGNRLPVKSGAAAGASHKQLFGMLCSMS